MKTESLILLGGAAVAAYFVVKEIQKTGSNIAAIPGTIASDIIGAPAAIEADIQKLFTNSNASTSYTPPNVAPVATGVISNGVQIPSTPYATDQNWLPSSGIGGDIQGIINTIAPPAANPDASFSSTVSGYAPVSTGVISSIGAPIPSTPDTSHNWLPSTGIGGDLQAGLNLLGGAASSIASVIAPPSNSLSDTQKQEILQANGLAYGAPDAPQYASMFGD